jgi:hypothetical protein
LALIERLNVLGLRSAVLQQDRDAIDNRITPSASLADDDTGLDSQSSMADGADHPPHVLVRGKLRAHGSILANRSIQDL